MAVLDVIGRSLLDALAMLGATLWALVLGFALSGAVQAFVSRDEMQRALGDHRPRSILRASAFGMASSSCSYAASALAKTLFQRGADFTAAMAFMFASTNLVVELGLVLWLLAGWQFALAELLGGALMVVELAFVLPRVVPAGELRATRARLQTSAAAADHEAARHPETTIRPETTSGHQETGDHAAGGDGDHAGKAGPPIWRRRLRDRRSWGDAAGYAVSDLAMVRRELAIGFAVAGFADIAVPVSFWRSLFWTGHGVASAVENALIGPLLAIVSFVCSVGNVPLAAALWTGGISFGGVVAFVFADLLTLPLLLIYRRYYGAALTRRLLVVFWAAISLAGFVTGELLSAAGLVPHVRTLRHGEIAGRALGWPVTSALDATAIAVLAAMYFLRRSRAATETANRHAFDPVCGMQVERAHAAASRRLHGSTHWFCSDHCARRFSADPDRFVAGPSQS